MMGVEDIEFPSQINISLETFVDYEMMTFVWSRVPVELNLKLFCMFKYFT